MTVRVVPWSALEDCIPLPALLGRDAAQLVADLAALPRGIERLAVLADERIVAAGLYVGPAGDPGRPALLAWFSADDDAPAEAAMALVDACEERARRDGVRTLEIAERRAAHVAPLLDARGYGISNAIVRMRAGAPRDVPALPDGVAERTLADAGVDAWVEVTNLSFSGVSFNVPVSRADAERRRAAPAFDERLVRVVVDASGPLGFLEAGLSPDGAGGEVEAIGVAPRARGRDLGRWLLRRAEELLRARGAATLVLRVAESNAAALSLYRREGYVELSRALVRARGL